MKGHMAFATGEVSHMSAFKYVHLFSQLGMKEGRRHVIGMITNLFFVFHYTVSSNGGGDVSSPYFHLPILPPFLL